MAKKTVKVKDVEIEVKTKKVKVKAVKKDKKVDVVVDTEKVDVEVHTDGENKEFVLDSRKLDINVTKTEEGTTVVVESEGQLPVPVCQCVHPGAPFKFKFNSNLTRKFLSMQWRLHWQPQAGWDFTTSTSSRTPT